MAENLKKQPRKGILKNSSSFDSNERNRESKAGTKFDEMNIIATLHPADKDYGHMKIDEPKTPYNYQKGESGDEADGLDADALARRLEEGGSNMPRAMVTPPPINEDSEEDDQSPEERAIKKDFEAKRKKHYNEFQAVKLARKLMEQEDSDDEMDEKGEDEVMSADSSPGRQKSSTSTEEML